MDDCLNTLARVDNPPDMLCPWVKLYRRCFASRPLSFIMSGTRQIIRPTMADSKGEQCFYLNAGDDHSFTAHKVLLASGVTSYTADVTFGYRRRPFLGEFPWGGGAVVSPSAEIASVEPREQTGNGLGAVAPTEEAGNGFGVVAPTEQAGNGLGAVAPTEQAGNGLGAVAPTEEARNGSGAVGQTGPARNGPAVAERVGVGSGVEKQPGVGSGATERLGVGAGVAWRARGGAEVEQRQPRPLPQPAQPPDRPRTLTQPAMNKPFSVIRSRGGHFMTPAVTRAQARARPHQVPATFALLATEDELAQSFGGEADAPIPTNCLWKGIWKRQRCTPKPTLKSRVAFGLARSRKNSTVSIRSAPFNQLVLPSNEGPISSQRSGRIRGNEIGF